MQKNLTRQAMSLGLSYTLGTFNDNFFKQAVLLLAVSLQLASVQAWGTVLFSLPFVLFSAWAGWLADRFPKRHVVLAAKLLEVAAMLAGAWGLLTLNWGGMLAMLFFMGASAALFSPALNGSLPEIFPQEQVPRANALLKLSTTLAILLGVVLAGAALESAWFATRIPFGRWLVALTVLGVALLGLCSVAFVPFRPAAARPEDLPPFPLFGAWNSAVELLRLRARQDIFLCLCADAFFYSLSVLVLLEINAFGLGQLGLSATLTSLLPGALMIGICGGALLSARRQQQSWQRTVPAASAAIGVLLLLVSCVPQAPAAWHFPLLCACYAAIGACGSLYIVPVSSYLQVRPAAGEKGRILGLCNFFSFLAMLLAGAAYYPLSLLTPAAGQALLGALSLLTAVLFAARIARLPQRPETCGPVLKILQRALGVVLRALLSLRYRVRLEGQDCLRQATAEAEKRGSGLLLLPNHPAYMDPVILCAWLAPWSPRPLADRHQIGRFWLRPLAAAMRCIPLPDLRREGIAARKQVQASLARCTAALEQGENLLVYPAGSLSHDGQTHLGGNSGAYRLLRAVPDCVPVVIRTHGLWGSSFSWADGAPSLGRSLGRALLALLRNGIFFLRRREVRITFVRPQPLSRMEDGVTALNALLEACYADEPDVLRRVPFSRREPEVPDQPLAVRENRNECPPPAGLGEKEYQSVIRLLADLSPLEPRPEDLRPGQRLDSDLGLDSLAIVDLSLQLATLSGQEAVEPGDLQTVNDCLLAVCGQLGPQSPTGEEALRELAGRWQASLRSLPRQPLILPQAPNLALTILRQIRRMPSRPILADSGQMLTGAAFWTRAVVLSLFLRRRVGSGQSLGIMLPASPAAAICWLAVLLSGNTPVMLNWTTGVRNLRHALSLTHVHHLISARALLRRLDEHALKKAVSESGVCWLLLEEATAALPFSLRLAGALRARLSLLGWEGCAVSRAISPRAAVLFTSGSSSSPKGVPLTHDNILANCRDVAAVLALDTHDVMLAMLPPFHSLGLTGNIVLPLCFGMPVVYHANPAEGGRLAALCRRWRPTLLVTPPTFLDGLLRQARPGDLESLRLGFVGAEACPQRIYEEFARQTGGGQLCEGYGVTECSPVVSVNLPEEARPCTIGRPLPSVEVAVVSPHPPYRRLEPGQTGLLLVRGPNVFDGYLPSESGDPAVPFVTLEGQRWYDTGDLVQADEAGRMTFAGRRERFIKLGGEMISLPQLEEVLRRHFAAGQTEGGPCLAVDAVYAEEQPQLTLYTTLPVSCAQANAVLRAEGFSGLQMLRHVRRLAALPLLGSGKIDYRRLHVEGDARQGG